jgi:hypothetical protein
MFKKLFNGIALSTITALVLSHANIAKAEDKGLGCGLGRVVAPKSTWVSATTQFVVDQVLPVQTSAMTTGTSGCAAHSIVKIDKRALHYTDANYELIEMDMARGQGEYLSGLVAVLGCNSGVVPTVGMAIKGNYNQIIPKTERNPDQMLLNVQQIINSKPDLKSGCNSNLI